MSIIVAFDHDTAEATERLAFALAHFKHVAEDHIKINALHEATPTHENAAFTVTMYAVMGVRAEITRAFGHVRDALDREGRSPARQHRRQRMLDE